MDDFIDLVSLSDEELKALIGTLTAEEHEVSRQRRILHGKIDILRAELVLRLQHHHLGGEAIITADDVSRLSEILAGKRPAADPDAGAPDAPPAGKD
jgi:hypothetical protein